MAPNLLIILQIPPSTYRYTMITIYIKETNVLMESYFDLKSNSIISTEQITKGQPSVMMDEFFEVEEIVKNSAEFKEALKTRGITSTDLVICDPWSLGNYGMAYEADAENRKRLVMAISFLKCDPEDNGYAHPIDGLLPIVDINEKKVICVENINPEIPIPKLCQHYERQHLKDNFQTDLKPLLISQPQGVSYTVDGSLVKWQNWSFRVAFSVREGIVLNSVTYFDKGHERSILNRAALNEMVIPYGDPRIQHFRKNAFDVGEYGIGLCANPLNQGCDCFGQAYFFDGYLNDSKGNVICMKNAICLHEEDNGIIWKHTNWRTDKVETRRSRRLVVSMIATLANYEYGFYWYFYLDGSIEFEVKLTGILQVGAAFDNECPKYGTIISPNLYAPIHIHFFNVRLDFAIDGLKNSIYEVTIEPETIGEHNPHSSAYYANFKLLETELDAASQMDAQKGKYWKIVNPNVKNQNGQPVAYRLEPSQNAFPYSRDTSSVYKRAGFMNKHLWVTPFVGGTVDKLEQFAAGNYPMQHPGGDGLPLWTKANRPIVNTDLVVWYTMGVFHLPRSEDIPIMPVGSAKFALRPDGFFDSNPAINLPPSCKSEKY